MGEMWLQAKAETDLRPWLEMSYLITYKKPQRDKHLETLLRSWWLQWRDRLLHQGWQRALNLKMQNAICPIKIKFKIQQPNSKWGRYGLY